MKALLFGTGAIGGGVVMPMLKEVIVVVAARNPERQRELSQTSRILVKKVNGGISEIHIALPHVINGSDEKAVGNVIADPEVRLIFTAIGASNLESVAKVLAPALKERSGPPLCILPFENVPKSGEVFKNFLEEKVPGSTKNVYTPSVVVDCMSFRQEGIIIREVFEETIISKTYSEIDKLISRFPIIQVEDTRRYYNRKIHLVSALHTAIAWLGIFAQIEYVNQAASDSRFSDFLFELIEELVEAVYFITKGNFNREELRLYAQKTVERVKNPHLFDSCLKFTRNLPNKLSPSERFGKPAIQLFNLNQVPSAICKIMGLGLWLGLNILKEVSGQCLEAVSQLPLPLSTEILKFAGNPDF